MKHKLLTGLILSLLLSLTFVLGGLFPQPIAGKVTLTDYPYPEGLILEQTNLRTGLSYTTTLDQNGFYLLDWGNLPQLDGDQVRISIKACEQRPECQKVVTLRNGAPVFADFTVGSSSAAGEEIKGQVVYYYVCQDGSVKEQASLCPAPVEPVPIIKEIVTERNVYRCQDETLVTNLEECPVDSTKKLLIGVTALVGLVAAGLSGLYLRNKRKYKWANGMIKILHGDLEKAKVLSEQGKKVEAEKKLKVLEKKATSILKKHIQQ